MRLMPTSMTAAPGLTMSRGDEPRPPGRRRRARRRRACAARGRACASGRSSPSRSPARAAARIGLPTISLRPTTTASRALELDLVLARAAPSRRAPSPGTSVGRPWSSSPAFAGWKPSTSFAGSTARIDALLVDPGRQRQLDEQRVRSRRRRSARRSSRAARPRRSSPGAAGRPARMPASIGRLVLEADVDVGRRVVADEHRRQPDAAELRARPRPPRANALGQRLAVHQRRCHREANLYGPRMERRRSTLA